MAAKRAPQASEYSIKIILVLFAVFCIYCFLYYNQVYQTYAKRSFLNTIQHISLAKKWAKGGFFLPHFGYHAAVTGFAMLFSVKVENAAIIMLSLFVTWAYYINYRIIKNHLVRLYSNSSIVIITVAVCLVIAIYCPWFSKRMYWGQGSPNYIINSTLVAVMPLGLLCFVYFLEFIRAKKAESIVRYAIILSGLLATSVFVKPSFAIVFIPAIIAYIILRNPYRPDFYIKVFVVILPALVVLAWQYIETFINSGGGYRSGIDIDFLRVWSIFSTNIPFSIVLATAFPFAVLLINPRRLFHSDAFLISWLMWFFGIAQWSLFVEKGKEFASNFIWGYNISLHILFLFCTIEFFIVLKSVEKKGWWKNAFVKFTFILFLSHLMSGIFYFARIISGGTYR